MLILLISTCELCIIFGIIEYKLAPQTRIILSAINLFLVLVEIVIYLYENVALKVPAYEWPVVEGLLLAVSLPGSFFVMLPNHSFEGSF